MNVSITTQTVNASSLVELLRQKAAHQPDQHAYTFLRQGETEEGRLTYGELDRQARTIAALLQSKGATAKPVLLLHQPGLAYIAAFLAACTRALLLYPPIHRARPVPCPVFRQLWPIPRPVWY